MDEVGRVTVVNGTKPTPRGSLLDGALGGFAFRPRAPKTERPPRPPRRSPAAWFRQHGRQVKDGVVSVAAFGSMSVAAFEWHPIAGLVAAGLSVLLVDKSIDRGAVSPVERPE
jgi:hypothetical protein